MAAQLFESLSAVALSQKKGTAYSTAPWFANDPSSSSSTAFAHNSSRDNGASPAGSAASSSGWRSPDGETPLEVRSRAGSIDVQPFAWDSVGSARYGRRARASSLDGNMLQTGSGGAAGNVIPVQLRRGALDAARAAQVRVIVNCFHLQIYNHLNISLILASIQSYDRMK